MGSYHVPEVDVLMVGAGFATFTLLNRLRKLGLSISVYEKAPESGGVWYWNCYPGARVDSDAPVYQLFDKELWEEFTFTERYPAGEELRRYFKYVENKWNIKDHVVYNKTVDGAKFDESRHRWLVECSDGSKTSCCWFIPNVGFASRHYTPPFSGLDNFRGDVYHTALWPQHDVNLDGKRVALFGQGATGIQFAQETGDKVKELTIYLRTPNYCLPMKQRNINPREEEEKKRNGVYEKEINSGRGTYSGFPFDFLEKRTFDDSPEEREKVYYNLLIEQGGFHFWLNAYTDMLFDQKANEEAYKFWRKTVLQRIKDPKKQELLAPEKAPHPWGSKRPSLEQRYYEVVDQPHVFFIDVNKSPVEEVSTTGIRTNQGLREYEIIVLATGFDAVTGSLAQLNIRDSHDKTVADHWKNGTRTSMGIAIPGFPNMFFLYGPQAPTAFSNGPSCVQFQAEFLEKTMKMIIDQGITRFEATQKYEDDWCKRLNETWEASLFPLAKSWFQGSNVPGKKVEPLYWTGGMVEYVNSLEKSITNTFEGWHISNLEAKP